MRCDFCKAEFLIKEKYIGKTCGCDEEERITPLTVWYEHFFKLAISNFTS